MSRISEETVKKIAYLARLQVNENELQGYTTQLSNILDLVEQMNEIDTKGISPMAHPQSVSLSPREDKITEPNTREALQALAPRQADGSRTIEAGLYLVNQVIE